MAFQRSRNSGNSVGVNRSLPPRTAGLLYAKAGAFTPTLIYELDTAIRKRGPSRSRERIDYPSKLVLHSGPFWTTPGQSYVIRMRHSSRGVH
jgi:hypothetical protein